MKVIIAGGNGFLGKALQLYFRREKYEVQVLTRNPNKDNEVKWDAKSLGSWASVLNGAAVLINLVGKSVDCRYTEKNRSEILSSRIDSTRVLQEAMNTCPKPPELWINASSATIYMHAETILMTEKGGTIGDDFSMGICKAWEKEFFRETLNGYRKVALRTSIVLGSNGGAFPKLKLLAKFGLGGTIGSGRQKMSWIHELDFCRAVGFIIKNQELNDVINVTAPTPLLNKDFMRKLRTAVKMPFGLPSPKPLLELGMVIFQSESELLLKSRNVYPELLLEKGFEFSFPEVEMAFRDLV